MPFGMNYSPVCFQRLIDKAIADLDGCEAYIADVITYRNTWEGHIRTLAARLHCVRSVLATSVKSESFD